MSKFLNANEVLQRLFDDDFGVSEDASSDDEGEGIFAYAGQQHIDAAEVAALSRGVASKGQSVPEGNMGATDSKGQQHKFPSKK